MQAYRRRRQLEEKRRLETGNAEDHLALGATTVAGTIAGAAVGAIAGAPGIVIGSIVGTAAGLLAGGTLEEDTTRRSRHDAELDLEIGVGGGDLGAAPPDAPPSHGRYSAASLGISSTGGSEEAAGPIQSVEEK